jgi:hypothetical protein
VAKALNPYICAVKEQELLTVTAHTISLPVFNRVRVAQSLVFSEVFCKSLFVLFPLAICCLSFFHLGLRITLFVSSNFFKNQLSFLTNQFGFQEKSLSNVKRLLFSSLI